VDWKLLLDDAQRLLSKGLHGAAAELLEEFLAESDVEPELLHMLARIRMLQGRPSEAVPLLKRALQLRADSFLATDSSRANSSRVPVASLNPSVPLTGSDTDDDWEVITAISAEQWERRRFFRPEEEHSGQQVSPAPVVSPTDHSSAAESGTKSLSDFGDGLLPDVQEAITQPPECVALGAMHQQPVGSSRRVELGEKPETTLSPGIVNSIQTEFEFELADHDWEDPAQIQFEEQLQGVLDVPEPEEELHVEDDQEDEFEAFFGLTAAAEPPDGEWDEFALNADDFDEAPTREDFAEVQTAGRLTRRQRAKQQAIKLGEEFDWDEEGIALLTEVFDRYWWSQAKESMRRELQAGMRPEELALALELRDIWAGHPEFAMDFSRLTENTLFSPTSAVYRNLSWPMALRLVRSTEGYPDVDCLEQFLCELFDEWYTHHTQLRRFKSFNLFLFFRLGMVRQELQEWPQWTFEPEEAAGMELDDDFEPGFCTPRYQMLNLLGVIPQVFGTQN